MAEEPRATVGGRGRKPAHYLVGGVVVIAAAIGVTLFLSRLSLTERDPGAAAGDLPSEVQLECGDDGLDILTPEVRPLADGVHLVVRNTSRHAITVRLEGHEYVFAVPSGTSRLTSPQPPGTVPVKCYTADAKLLEDSFKVVDTEGLWSRPDLECDDYSGFGGETGGPARMTDPVELVRYQFPGLRETDVIKLAGYPHAPVGVAVVLRNGARIASVEYRFVGGDLYFKGATVCEGTELLR